MMQRTATASRSVQYLSQFLAQGKHFDESQPRQAFHLTVYNVRWCTILFNVCVLHKHIGMIVWQ